MLEADVDRILAAPTVLEWLDERHPGRFNASHLRTLQRRIRDWRALNGPEREVYFEQKHPPGREAQMDFTHCDSLKVTIGGEPFAHMVFEFILSHSGWRYAQICFSETFVALVSGLQGALWELGSVPEVVRSDNLSAATHKLKDGKGRDFNERYKEILDHYGLKATRTNSYSAHENGVAEQGHRRLKDAVAQALVLRGSSDFESVEQYAKFVRSIVDRRNRLVREKLAGEYPHLRALPPAPVPEYVSYSARVLKWSTIRVDSRTYSVPSRLIGVMVDVRLYPDHVEVYYKGHLVESMERIRGKGKARIDYRHIIGSLVRKPGAFARYRFREQLMLLSLSSGLIEWLNRLSDGGVDFSGHITFETADDVALAHSLCGSTTHVCLGSGIMAQSDEDYAIESGIGLTVAAAVEPVPVRLAG